jgi:hypothetical protein
MVTPFAKNAGIATWPPTARKPGDYPATANILGAPEIGTDRSTGVIDGIIMLSATKTFSFATAPCRLSWREPLADDYAMTEHAMGYSPQGNESQKGPREILR